MMEVIERQPNRRREYAVYLTLSVVSLLFFVFLLPSSGAHFRRFFGETSAILVIVAASVAGGAALWVLRSSYGFTIFKGRGTLRGMALSAGFATVLGVAIVIADLVIRYPEDLNVPVPQALLFYPAIGFVAEIVFHILPLTLLLLVFKPLAKPLGRERVVWLGIVLVAILEPSYQILFGGEVFTPGMIYTWLHIFAIAFLQLYVFKRFDFVTMYSFRLFYYAYWHILWGMIRLEVLF
ncbi:MAG: hypothetical protein JSW54_02775 [Fidelibacterota bacterium]|nr:MAG: hypothetical protein JSW54_02775 [Candidatus Neomarinimicrobiota bacterium]